MHNLLLQIRIRLSKDYPTHRLDNGQFPKLVH